MTHEQLLTFLPMCILVSLCLYSFFVHQRNKQERQELLDDYEKVNLDLMRSKEYYNQQKADLNYEYNMKLRQLLSEQTQQSIDWEVSIPDHCVEHDFTDYINEMMLPQHYSSGTSSSNVIMREPDPPELTRCHYCNSRLKGDYETCPKCGAPV